MINKRTIWSFAQNKPSLIANDLLEYGISKEITHRILLTRGVYKWLAVRRHLIKTKDVWKNRIKTISSELKLAKKSNNGYQVGYFRGYLKAYEECRADIRSLCHSERWQAPDFDKEAIKFLETLEDKNQ